MCKKIQVSETALDCITMPWFFLTMKRLFADKYGVSPFDVCNMCFEETTPEDEEREVFCTAIIHGKKVPMILS